MFVLITGGAASGKSNIAEAIATKLGGSMAYIATMQPYGEEGKARIERHTKLRAGKGFDTIEKYTNLSAIHLVGYETSLLECISNLLANELFAEEGAKEEYFESITNGINTIRKSVKNLVIVTNEVFSDGNVYDEDTSAYMSSLGILNKYLANEADIVLETVCGIPIFLKGELAI